MAVETKPAATTKDRHHAASPEAAAQQSPAGGEPIIVDLGKKKRKDVRKLRKGEPGKLLSRVEETIAHLRETGAITADAQPIIFVVKQSPSTGRVGKSFRF